MPVSLPERTVDAWVAAYLVSRMPSAILWAPTQLHHPDYDLAAELPGPGKLFVLENKAPSTQGAVHGFRLATRQLYNYLCHPALRKRTFYVLPCPPFGVGEVPAVAVAPPPAAPTLVPKRATTRTSGHRFAPHQGCEEWFFVVSARNLWTFLLPRHTIPTAQESWWPKGDPAPRGLPTVLSLDCPLTDLPLMTLEEFVDDLRACNLGDLRVDPDEQPKEVVTGKKWKGESLDTTLVVHAPRNDLPGW